MYRGDDSIQAPNWTPDGKALIYNRNGRLYRFDLATREPTEIDTDFAIENNNDHALSFDGKMLAISHRRDAESNSIVYTVPVEGGVPKEITPVGPSYLHGWSPDGKTLVFTGGRDGNHDIYSIASDGSGEEQRLTTWEGLDDGPEFSPDGSFIYFNSTAARPHGNKRMQIWRMPPGGYEHEQVTDDEFNNWFPHISPDGKQIVFISYGDDVEPEDHPFYKQCYLRLMPYPGGPAARDRLCLWRAGDDQRAELVAGQQADRVCEQHGGRRLTPLVSPTLCGPSNRPGVRRRPRRRGRACRETGCTSAARAPSSSGRFRRGRRLSPRG